MEGGLSLIHPQGTESPSLIEPLRSAKRRRVNPLQGWGRGVTQRILYGGRWRLPPNPGRGESSESEVARGLSQHQMDAE
jgi:hypothetical protein